MALESDSTVLTLDNFYMDIGALFRVNISGPNAGTRSVLTTGVSHFGTVAISTGGNILIGTCNAPSGASYGICSVDPVTGVQTVVSDFNDKSQGVTGLPLSIAVLPGIPGVFANGFEP